MTNIERMHCFYTLKRSLFSTISSNLIKIHYLYKYRYDKKVITLETVCGCFIQLQQFHKQTDRQTVIDVQNLYCKSGAIKIIINEFQLIS